MSFVHLHTHSEYSLLEASLRIKDMAKKAADHGQSALALTDNGNMFGAIEFYFACLDKGVKPIIGMDVYLTASRHNKTQDRNAVFKPNTRLVLLAQNFNGYQKLCQISSIGYQEGFYYKPRIDYDVLKNHTEDIICLSGGSNQISYGEIAWSFLNEGPDQALEKIKNLKSIFGDRFYLELCQQGLSHQPKINAFLSEAGEKLQVPLVASNDVHFLRSDDLTSQEVLICIGTNKTLADEHRLKLGSDQFYLKSTEEMTKLFPRNLDAVERSAEIAERCQVKFKLKDESGKAIYHLPSFPTELADSPKDEIRLLSLKGLEERFVELAGRDETVPEEKKPDYFKRLDYELSIIDRMGFNGYFLIVQDFINWAKKNDIPVGPGRGSGAGSLVAYTLKITDLDPLPNFLLFERFLNPERISMPDFDIDFCQDRRVEVINYVTNKYGAASVSQIITYGKLQARAAIKDVGRVLGLTFPEVNEVTGLIPDVLNITITKSLEMEPRIQDLMDSNPTVATLIDLALRVEGMVRHAGIHAAGVIIADGKLMDHAPLYKGADGENVVQYDMKHAEKIGLIKFDFLGLKTLTHIQHALKLIKENKNVEIHPHQISMRDSDVYELMSRGDTAGVFQFEGEGITDATRKIRPSSFADITAITSLYRPGPMANIPSYTKRKHGEEPIEYLLPETKSVLEETYGIMVYQEQVMGIASQIAGYSLGEADMLRRAMGKKNKEEMDRQRLRFLKGAKDKGHDEKKTDELFDLMYKFADYGFNKSHAAAYSVITVQTAWIKAHYPSEFFAALLSTELGNTDNVVKYVKDAQNSSRQRGLTVNPPHINQSEYLFTVRGEDIYFGLGAIKGLGESAIDAIVLARNSLPEKKFTSLSEFFEIVDSKKLNKKVLECLIKSGALDGFGYHRAQLMGGYSQFLERAEVRRKERELGQVSLFDMETADQSESEIVIEAMRPWPRALSLSNEKEVLGFYLSDHPLKGLEKVASRWTTGFVSDLQAINKKFKESVTVEAAPKYKPGFKRDVNKKRVILSGLISGLRDIITKKGTRMAVFRFEDLTGSCEAIAFPDTYAQFEGILKQDQPVLVGGALEIDEGGTPKIIVDNVSLLTDVIRKTRKVKVSLEELTEEELNTFESVVKDYPGTTQVVFQMNLPELGKKIFIETEKPMEVGVNQEFFETLQSSLGRTSFVELDL